MNGNFKSFYITCVKLIAMIALENQSNWGYFPTHIHILHILFFTLSKHFFFWFHLSYSTLSDTAKTNQFKISRYYLWCSMLIIHFHLPFFSNVTTGNNCPYFSCMPSDNNFLCLLIVPVNFLYSYRSTLKTSLNLNLIVTYLSLPFVIYLTSNCCITNCSV